MTSEDDMGVIGDKMARRLLKMISGYMNMISVHLSNLESRKLMGILAMIFGHVNMV